MKKSELKALIKEELRKINEDIPTKELPKKWMEDNLRKLKEDLRNAKNAIHVWGKHPGYNSLLKMREELVQVAEKWIQVENDRINN